ncbi:MAG: hypothetical protein GX754_06385 [Clostridiaceae bacterium]|nr:hypothetical protein [Clostridiaceae bacterium]
MKWKKNENNSSFKSRIDAFFKKNRTLVYTLPLLLVLVVVLVIIYSNQDIAGYFGSRPATVENLDDEKIAGLIKEAEGKVEVLPNMERTLEIKEGEGAATNLGNETLYDPFQQPVTISGILYDEKGKSVAIIETGEKSYVVIEGDSVNQNWKVAEITSSTVVLKAGEKEITLSLSNK